MAWIVQSLHSFFSVLHAFFFFACLTTENARNILIKSAVRRAESTGANCTPKEISEMLTTQPSDAKSLGDEEMSGTDDVRC